MAVEVVDTGMDLARGNANSGVAEAGMLEIVVCKLEEDHGAVGKDNPVDSGVEEVGEAETSRDMNTGIVREAGRTLKERTQSTYRFHSVASTVFASVVEDLEEELVEADDFHNSNSIDSNHLAIVPGPSLVCPLESN